MLNNRTLEIDKPLIEARLSQLRSLGIDYAVTQAREATAAPILAKPGFKTTF